MQLEWLPCQKSQRSYLIQGSIGPWEAALAWFRAALSQSVSRHPTGLTRQMSCISDIYIRILTQNYNYEIE